MIEYEFWNLTIDRTKSRSAVCRMLTDAAEYQGWELDRLRKDGSGQRTVTLRRKIILAPVSRIADLPEDPQLVFRRFFRDVPHPAVGRTLRFPGAPG